MPANKSPKRKIGSPKDSLSDIQVVAKFLHDLQKISGGGLTPSNSVELHEIAERLKIFRERAVRKLKLDGHGFTEMALHVGCHTNDIIAIHTPGVADG